MTDSAEEKSDLEKSRDLISQMKEILHYSKSNVEKLTEFWLTFDEELKQQDMVKKMEDLLSMQNGFHDSLGSVISDYEMECNRIENESH